MKNILIVYTSSGLGHKKIAEHIRAVLKNDHQITLVDLFDVEKGNLVSGGTKSYIWILKKAPWLWNFFYTNKTFLGLTSPLRRLLAGFLSERLQKVLESQNYDVVVTTQVNASAIVSYLKLKKMFLGKFVVTFSDFHLHKYWLFDNVDAYLANTEEQKKEMGKLGIDSGKIFVCGITVPSETRFVSSEIRKEFAVSENEKIVLVLGGGKGLGIDVPLVEQLSKVSGKVFVVCGQNAQLKKELEKTFGSTSNVRIFGFIDYVSKLYSIADVVVGKPGGLTVAEVLSYGVPMFLVNAIAGQETLNQKYLVENHLAIAGESEILVKQISEELSSASFKNQLVQNPQRMKIVGDGSQVKRAINGL